MFNINDYPEIILHIKSYSKVHSVNTTGWHECFCPYCDDATRKFNPNHGHFFIAPSYPYGHCFRCEAKVSLSNFLIKTGFTNQAILKKLDSISKFVYGSDYTSTSIAFDRTKILPIYNTICKLKHHYIELQKNNIVQYNKFKNYLYSRCLDINPINFLIYPNIYQNKLMMSFINYDGNIITSRYIDESNERYVKPFGNKNYYYFQDISHIETFKTIVITEGQIDLINLFNFVPEFNESFFISIGDGNYKMLITNLINTFLLIGNYTLIIVYDNGIKHFEKKRKQINEICNMLNPEITIQSYIPKLSKDVSEIMLLEKLL